MKDSRFAIDGDLSTSYCARTQYKVEPWWRVDLMKNTAVIGVLITTKDRHGKSFWYREQHFPKVSCLRKLREEWKFHDALTFLKQATV